MTEENFKVLLLVEGSRREQGRIVFYDCEMTACVWGENDKEQWVCMNSSGMSHGALMGMWLWTLWYFRTFCMPVLWKVISYNSSRNSFKEMRCPLKLYSTCLILMLLHLTIYFIVVQTLCISIQNNQLCVKYYSHFIIIGFSFALNLYKLPQKMSEITNQALNYCVCLKEVVQFWLSSISENTL